jgi:hypothetical protein
MPEDLRRVSPDELAAALAKGLTHEGRKAWHRADDIMSAIVAGELVDVLGRAGFVIMRKPPVEGGAAIGRGSTCCGSKREGSD